MADGLDGLLSALEERANTARTIFMLLDSDADGLVAVEQVFIRTAWPLPAPSLAPPRSPGPRLIHPPPAPSRPATQLCVPRPPYSLAS